MTSRRLPGMIDRRLANPLKTGRIGALAKEMERMIKNMISDIVQAIADKLADLYPGYKIYTDDILQDFVVPSFLIILTAQDYRKRICGNDSTAAFDVAYYSDKGPQDIKGDCRAVQENLLQSFNLLRTFRATGKSAQVIDGVLHLKFTVRYSEIDLPDEILMRKKETNTNL